MAGAASTFPTAPEPLGEPRGIGRPPADAARDHERPGDAGDQHEQARGDERVNGHGRTHDGPGRGVRPGAPVGRHRCRRWRSSSQGRRRIERPREPHPRVGRFGQRLGPRTGRTTPAARPTPGRGTPSNRPRVGARSGRQRRARPCGPDRGPGRCRGEASPPPRRSVRGRTPDPPAADARSPARSTPTGAIRARTDRRRHGPSPTGRGCRPGRAGWPARRATPPRCASSAVIRRRPRSGASDTGTSANGASLNQPATASKPVQAVGRRHSSTAITSIAPSTTSVVPVEAVISNGGKASHATAARSPASSTSAARRPVRARASAGGHPEHRPRPPPAPPARRPRARRRPSPRRW